MHFKQFNRHICDFMGRANLWPESGRGVVAVSGGLDSMALLTVLSQLRDMGKLKSLKAIHIDHGTKENSQLDVTKISSYCEQLGVELTVQSLKLSIEMSNFEASARDLRYKIFQDQIQNGDLLFTAHHLDDSFEWSLMQQFKSSSNLTSLGIPVIRDFVVRPFLCVSRKQIEDLVKNHEIPFLEDPSNADTRFERNYLRHVVIPQIAERFPSYLKHYAHRSNDRAIKMGRSRFEGPKDWRVHHDSSGGIALIHPTFERSFDGAEQQIMQIISSLSEAKRGILRSQVQKMISAVKVGKMGPMKFSGGVIGHMSQGALYFTKGAQAEAFKRIDSHILEKLRTGSTFSIDRVSFEQVENHLYQSEYTFPGLLFSNVREQCNIPNSLRKVHPLLPESTSFALSQNIWFHSTFKLLSHWKKAGAEGVVSLFLP